MKNEPKLWHIPLGMVLALVAIALIMCACKSVEYVPVPEVHEVHHHHMDSVIQRDSVVKESMTTVMQLDSAEMAKYGIQMESNKRAWLVLQRQMENRLRELEHMTAQRDTVRDSIPVPYPVENQVPTPLTWWQQTRMHVGGIVIFLLIIFVVWKIYVTLHTR